MTVESPPALLPALHVTSAISVARLPHYVLKILRQRGVTGGPVLLLTSVPLVGEELDAAPQFQLTSGTLGEASSLAGRAAFAAVVVLIYGSFPIALEALLASIARRLEPGALLVLTLRSTSFAALSGDREAAHLLLLRAGYNRVWTHRHGRMLCTSAQRAPAQNARRTCSIIVPVFNEKDTFLQLMRALLNKRLDHLGLEREIILVESNSTDGTREQVASFATTPGVRIIWQDRPRGKGFAVREGFQAATGDIVLIQDADLEYDVDDYDALLEPLLRDQAAFVLGSRHSGRVRMRRFTDQRVLGDVLNGAHLVFTAVLNILYGQNMKDPFTMFKVLRRDCLYGLTFECNRFDFDHELVIKLLLKGYRPLEIPVNYCSRSFKEGKKIRFFRDPPTWIAADLKFRLRPLRPKF